LTGDAQAHCPKTGHLYRLIDGELQRA